MRILVVDDEIMQLQNLKIGLHTEGHLVVTAQSAEEALEQVKKSGAVSFDLIITDYLMRGNSGLDLLKSPGSRITSCKMGVHRHPKGILPKMIEQVIRYDRGDHRITHVRRSGIPTL
jgi:DNA-binding NtrC family response regulator